MKPGVLLSFKSRRLLEKDKEDADLIRANFINDSQYNWDWDIFSYEYYPKSFNNRGLPTNSANSLGSQPLAARFITKLSNDGTFNIMSATSNYIVDNISRKMRKERGGFVEDPTLKYIIWPNAIHHSELLINRIDTDIGVIQKEELELGDELDKFITDIYHYGDDNRLLEYKINELTKNETKILILETKCPVVASGEPDETFLPKWKKGVRMEFYPYFDSYHNMMHGPDSIEENQWVKQVVDSYK